MKKLISMLLLTTLMLCCFTGCGNDDDTSSENNSYYPSQTTASAPTNASYSGTSTAISGTNPVSSDTKNFDYSPVQSTQSFATDGNNTIFISVSGGKIMKLSSDGSNADLITFKSLNDTISDLQYYDGCFYYSNTSGSIYRYDPNSGKDESYPSKEFNRGLYGLTENFKEVSRPYILSMMVVNHYFIIARKDYPYSGREYQRHLIVAVDLKTNKILTLLNEMAVSQNAKSSDFPSSSTFDYVDFVVHNDDLYAFLVSYDDGWVSPYKINLNELEKDFTTNNQQETLMKKCDGFYTRAKAGGVITYSQNDIISFQDWQFSYNKYSFDNETIKLNTHVTGNITSIGVNERPQVFRINDRFYAIAINYDKYNGKKYARDVYLMKDIANGEFELIGSYYTTGKIAVFDNKLCFLEAKDVYYKGMTFYRIDYDGNVESVELDTNKIQSFSGIQAISNTEDITRKITECYAQICSKNSEVYPKIKTAPDTVSFADVAETNNMNDICQNVQYNNQTYRLVWNKDSNYCYFINDNNDTLVTTAGTEKKLSNFVKLTDDNGFPSKTVMINSLFD